MREWVNGKGSKQYMVILTISQQLPKVVWGIIDNFSTTAQGSIGYY